MGRQLALIGVLMYAVIGVQSQDPRLLGFTEISLAGFSNMYENPSWTDPRDRYNLLLSTFNPIPGTRDTSYVYLNIGEFLTDIPSLQATPLYDDFDWPRSPSQTPVDVFGYETVTQPDGFLPPGKNNGSIYVIDVRDWQSPVVHNIGYDPSEETLWFYHQVTWKDIDGDGLIDALTCRAYEPTIGQSQEQMLWFRQPAGDPFAPVFWEANVLLTGVCDTFQYLTTLSTPDGDFEALFTVGYFTQTLAVSWTTDPTGNWDNPAFLNTRIIDTGRQFFDVRVADLNNDGNPDLLVPWNAEVNGALAAYEIPTDFRTGDYITHVLASGFNATSGLSGGGSPGQVIPFYYDLTNTVNKPWICLSGDDAGAMFILKPLTESTSDWNYSIVPFLDLGARNIAASPSIADVDGDNLVEIFAPAYNEGRVYLYTYG